MKSTVQPHKKPPSSAEIAPRPMLAGPRAVNHASVSPLASCKLVRDVCTEQGQCLQQSCARSHLSLSCVTAVQYSLLYSTLIKIKISVCIVGAHHACMALQACTHMHGPADLYTHAWPCRPVHAKCMALETCTRKMHTPAWPAIGRSHTSRYQQSRPRQQPPSRWMECLQPPH